MLYLCNILPQLGVRGRGGGDLIIYKVADSLKDKICIELAATQQHLIGEGEVELRGKNQGGHPCPLP